MAPSETPLSREKLHGNYDHIVGESTVHLEVLKSIDTFAKSSKIVLISGYHKICRCLRSTHCRWRMKQPQPILTLRNVLCCPFQSEQP